MKEDVIIAYQKIRQKRAQAEDIVKQLKEQENILRADLLAAMDAAGLDQFVSADYTVYKKGVLHVEVADHTILQSTMYDLMSKAHAEGRPLQDGLLLNRSANKTSVIDLIRSRLGLSENEELDINSPAVQEEAGKIGVRLVETQDVGLRKKSK